MILASTQLETGKKGECLNKFFAVTMILCLVLGFQNCSKSALQSSENLGNNNVTVSLPSSGEGKTVANVTYIEIPNAERPQDSLKISEVVPISGRLVISLQTGVMQLVDDSNAVLEKRCLSGSSLNELNTILGGSSICATASPSSDICGMSYKPAYASLYADDTRVKLGEEQDTCGTGKKDLCGDLAPVFQAYVSYVKAHWQEMNCQ